MTFFFHQPTPLTLLYKKGMIGAQHMMHDLIDKL